MCGSCDINWVKNTWESCTECPSYNTSLTNFAIRIALITIFVMGVSSLQVSCSADNQNAAFIALIKLIINHCVLVSAVSEIKYNWSEIVKNVITVQSVVVNFLSKFTQFNCLINGTTDLLTPRNDDFYNSLVFTLLAPLYYVLWFSLLFFIQKTLTKNSEDVKQVWMSMVVVVLWMCYPDICHMVFATFACIDVDGSDQQRLFYDLEVVCW